MNVIIDLYSSKPNEISRFLSQFYSNNICEKQALKWEKNFENPIEVADIVGVFVDNNYKFNINMWISLDNDFFINVVDNNVNQIIKYLYERYPY